MKLRLLHRRLAVLMGMAGLIAFSGGAGFEPFTTALAFLALTGALFWHPSPDRSARMERVWLPLATLLVVRALLHVFVIRGDVVIPVVDLLLLLMAAEALRSLDAPNDVRLYALSFALILAATAYRPGVLFLVGFVSYVGLATVSLMVGHLRRSSERHGVTEVHLGRALYTTTMGLAAMILVVAGVVFVTFPRVSQGWTGRGETTASSIAGFSDEVSLGQHGSSIQGNPAIVLRVEFPGGAPANVGNLRWRGRSYDRFDGVRWSRSRSLPPASAPRSWYDERWPGPRIEQRIFGAPLDTRVLFALHPTIEISADNGIQPLFDNAGDFLYWGSGAPSYTAISPAYRPSPDLLREAEGRFIPSDRFFLQLPELDPGIKALADSLTEGIETNYDRAVAIERWLKDFRYTRELPATAAQTSLEYFLFERRAGHCEYFSTAMVVLLRSIGIPARNVNGFLGGSWSEFGNYLVVTQNEAHSWVEVWFPGYGWVPFDPTPAGVGSTDAGSSWFWPGRILFDGIQHRWSKWVLDYGVDDQSGLLSSWSGLWNGTSDTATDGVSGERTEGSSREYLVPGLAVIALLLIWLRTRGNSARPSAATRTYLSLRRICEHSGMSLPPGLTPSDLLRRIDASRPAAAGPSGRVVELYLRNRFGGLPLGTSELREMKRALSAARAALRESARAENGAGVRKGVERVSS